MDSGPAQQEPPRPRPGWPRAVALLGLTLGTAVLQPAVLVALPFVLLVAVLGVRRALTLPALALAGLIAASGWPRDGLWYIERAWALVLGGWFTALTLLRPHAPTSARALGSVLGAGAALALLLASWDALVYGTEAGPAWGYAWSAIDWTISDRMVAGVSSVLQAIATVRGSALPPALAGAIYETVDLQTSIFPAMLALASMAALGVAWWIYVRLAEGSDQGLGPMRDFRFNDHMVWLFIGGIVLLVGRVEDVLARVGSNAVVFMGALYALRGAAVVVFVSGGLSFASYLLLALALLVMPPVILGAVMVVGLGDTWLGFRARLGARST